MLQLLSDLVYPLLILLGAAAYAGLTLVQAVVKSDVPVLTSLAAFRDRAFANFWRLQGAWSYKVSRPHVAPLLPRAKGRVLDIGTGTGHWLEFYDRTKLTRLYAVEPNGNHHAALWQKARKAGLQDVFEVLSAPVEALQSQAGIGRGSIDTVVTVQVLCSIPEPEAMVRDLYSYLKPGGQWIVYEHVRTPSDGLISYYQGILCIDLLGFTSG